MERGDTQAACKLAAEVVPHAGAQPAVEDRLPDLSVDLPIRSESGRIVWALTLVIRAIPSGTRAWIEDVVVDEAARGKGVGSALILDAVGRATAEGAKSIDLTSRPSRADAKRLYERLGFVLRDSNLYRFEGNPDPT